MSLVFANNPQYEFELLRVMGQTSYGAAEIGECLTTARRVVKATTTAGTASGPPSPSGCSPKARTHEPVATA